MNIDLTHRVRLNAVFEAYENRGLPVLAYLTVLVLGTSVALFADVRLGVSLKFLIPLTLLFTGFLLLAVPYVFQRIKGAQPVTDIDRNGEANEAAGLSAEQFYTDHRDRAKFMIDQLQRSDISPQTRVILLKVLYALVQAESLRQHGYQHGSYRYNDGLYSALTLVYGEVEEIFNSLRIDNAGVHQSGTKGEVSSRQ